ncbi:cytosine deaminase protein-like protein [Amniculicola lignicola CBS 123094]|uniref:Cytosine deaminase protein-like protein n=1 Tax=Amniculicola lignicola CBS 123094 TaxID=1392246 RepID=A0A6A5WLP0_9PLEO|nr:cytosine deaminase protein-like protein [Amniculicola lignicola CBS 123094]
MYPPTVIRKIVGVQLPNRPLETLWDLAIEDGKIATISSHDEDPASYDSLPGILEGCGRLVAPSLCHAHIHLDKCFLLQNDKYSDLQIEKGDFQEAMDITAEAKSRFDDHDLMSRGRQLIEESIHYGVTAMRAFVEVDAGVQFKCLDAGMKLKEEFKQRVDIQICAFAQLPLFSGEGGGKQIRSLMSTAAHQHGVDVVGSTPYVEDDEAASKKNVSWLIDLAITADKYIDWHLDYFLELDKKPLIWSVLEILKEKTWMEKSGKQITLGHCTRLTRFQEEEWRQLKDSIGNLPIAFVGLPTSDLFMMRTKEGLRGTLPVMELIDEYSLEAAIAVNNVGNAFTPQGNCDPMSIASLGVGVYQAGTKHATEILYASQTVSSRAKTAIGYTHPTSLELREGEPADLVLYDGADTGWRAGKSIAEIVYDPPRKRQTIWRGKVTGY